MKKIDTLCEGCPLRTIGLSQMHDVTNGYGGLLIEEIDKGDTVSLKPLRPSYAFVRSGVLKIESIAPDGSASIIGFLFSGEPVPASLADMAVTVTALTKVRLCRLSAQSVLSREEGSAQILKTFCEAALAQALADQQRFAQARSGDAADRLHWFLTDISERTNSRAVDLCMSRTEIADYLGLRPESVSRAIKTLQCDGRLLRRGVRALTVA